MNNAKNVVPKIMEDLFGENDLKRLAENAEAVEEFLFEALPEHCVLANEGLVPTHGIKLINISLKNKNSVDDITPQDIGKILGEICASCHMGQQCRKKTH